MCLGRAVALAVGAQLAVAHEQAREGRAHHHASREPWRCTLDLAPPVLPLPRRRRRRRQIHLATPRIQLQLCRRQCLSSYARHINAQSRQAVGRIWIAYSRSCSGEPPRNATRRPRTRYTEQLEHALRVHAPRQRWMLHTHTHRYTRPINYAPNASMGRVQSGNTQGDKLQSPHAWKWQRRLSHGTWVLGGQHGDDRTLQHPQLALEYAY